MTYQEQAHDKQPKDEIGPWPESETRGRNRIVLLGTGTCELQERRRASSVLVELDGVRVVYDLGRGIADRLADLGLRQDDLCHVVFSHFHPDHVSDLVPFLQAAAWSRVDPRSEDLHLYGPRGLENQMMRLLSLFEVDNLTRDSWRVHLHEVRSATDDADSEPAGSAGAARPTIEVAGRAFEWVSLPPAGNHGLGIEGNGRRVVLTGDSSFHQQEVELLRGADLAIIDSGHLEDDEIVRLAVESGVGTLVCSHVYRELDAVELEARARREGYGGRLLLGRDLDSFCF